MRVSSYAVARPAYYDRNAASSVLTFGTSLAPHTSTIRGTFTTAAGKKAYLETATIYLRQETAATTIGRTIAVIYITASASSPNVARIDSASSLVAQTSRTNQMSGQPTLYAGETLTFLTLDESIGGTIDTVIGAKITTFDV